MATSTPLTTALPTSFAPVAMPCPMASRGLPMFVPFPCFVSVVEATLPDRAELRHEKSSSSHLLSPGDDQGDVVELFAGGEAADIGDDGTDEIVCGKMTMAFERVDEALFTEFLVGSTGRFGQAVGIDGKQVAGLDAAVCQGTSPLLEHADDGAGGFQAFDDIVAAQHQGGEMPAVGVTQASGAMVELGEEQRGVGMGIGVFVEQAVDKIQHPVGM